MVSTPSFPSSNFFFHQMVGAAHARCRGVANAGSGAVPHGAHPQGLLTFNTCTPAKACYINTDEMQCTKLTKQRHVHTLSRAPHLRRGGKITFRLLCADPTMYEGAGMGDAAAGLHHHASHHMDMVTTHVYICVCTYATTKCHI